LHLWHYFILQMNNNRRLFIRFLILIIKGFVLFIFLYLILNWIEWFPILLFPTTLKITFDSILYIKNISFILLVTFSFLIPFFLLLKSYYLLFWTWLAKIFLLSYDLSLLSLNNKETLFLNDYINLYVLYYKHICVLVGVEHLNKAEYLMKFIIYRLSIFCRSIVRPLKLAEILTFNEFQYWNDQLLNLGIFSQKQKFIPCILDKTQKLN
jgi:hypothetical protein